MRKQSVKILATCCCVMLVMLTGCGAKNGAQNSDETPKKENVQTQQGGEQTENPENEESKEENTEEIKTDDQSEKQTIEGTIAEKKDFMFVIEDSDKTPYAFAFSGELEGYDELKVDDYVSVEYTGEISEVDAFTGEVLSITKIDMKDKQN